MLTAKSVRRLFHYDPLTGEMTRLVKMGNQEVGARIDSINHSGYYVTSVRKKKHRKARLAWVWMTGKWPKKFIDHIDGDRLNDKWCNLREATVTENNQNRKTSNNKIKLLGVHFHKRDGKWTAAISHKGKQKHLGTFATDIEAHNAYVAAKRKLHKFCTI